MAKFQEKPNHLRDENDEQQMEVDSAVGPQTQTAKKVVRHIIIGGLSVHLTTKRVVSNSLKLKSAGSACMKWNKMLVWKRFIAVATANCVELRAPPKFIRFPIHHLKTQNSNYIEETLNTTMIALRIRFRKCPMNCQSLWQLRIWISSVQMKSKKQKRDEGISARTSSKNICSQYKINIWFFSRQFLALAVQSVDDHTNANELTNEIDWEPPTGVIIELNHDRLISTSEWGDDSMSDGFAGTFY